MPKRMRSPYSISACTPYAISGRTPYSISALSPYAISARTPYAISGRTPYAISARTPYAISACSPYAISACRGQSVAKQQRRVWIMALTHQSLACLISDSQVPRYWLLRGHDPACQLVRSIIGLSH